jgi:pyruvate/2-oxoglutarate dehydrogenase complex dihydrolipoamide acyltransferase (E2) component
MVKNTPGEYQIKKISWLRRLAVESFDAIPAGHNMMALAEFDITEARKTLRELKKNGRKVSLFAFVVKSIAQTIGEYKELNSMRMGNRIIEFKEIDVNAPIELNSGGEKFPHQIIIRDAARKTVEEINHEINMAKKQYQQSGDTGKEDKWILTMMKILLILPKFIRALILRKFANDPFNIKKMSGTTFITSVTTIVSGFAIPYLIGQRAVSFALGGVAKKPAVVGQDISIRELLSMTVIFNHDIVDGAPAARFVKRLKGIIENADVLHQL